MLKMLLNSINWFKICICLSLFITCNSNIKTWNSNIEFNDRNNWNQRSICQNNRIVFSDNSVVYLDEKLEAKEIVLPKNGQIILGDKSSIYLTDNSKSNDHWCEGKDLIFHTKQYDWFDPYNWNQSIDIILSNQSIYQFMCSGRSDQSNPIPHIERIPCHYDSVYFLLNTTFKVNVETDHKISIKYLRIWDKSYDTQSFKSLIETDIGQQIFQIKNYDNNDFLIDQNFVCNDPKGCLCGNEDPIVFSKVCAAVYLRGCPTLQCLDPIRPVGHCCDICASMLTITIKNDFNLDLIQGIRTAFKTKPEYNNVVSYFHKLKNSKFQLISMDLGEKGLADTMAKAIKQYFDDGPGIYAIESIRINSSVNWKTSSSLGVWLAIIVILLVAVGIIAAVTYHYKKKSVSTAFAFARFHGFDNEDRVELEMGTTPHEALDPNAPLQSSLNPNNESINFENPIFLKHHKKETEASEQKANSEITSVENPFFEN